MTNGAPKSPVRGRKKATAPAAKKQAVSAAASVSAANTEVTDDGDEVLFTVRPFRPRHAVVPVLDSDGNEIDRVRIRKPKQSVSAILMAAVQNSQVDVNDLASGDVGKDNFSSLAQLLIEVQKVLPDIIPFIALDDHAADIITRTFDPADETLNDGFHVAKLIEFLLSSDSVDQ